jgi:glycosyltransferase involved in cell wall biosynthesis
VHDNLTTYKGVSLYDLSNFRNKSFEAIVHTFRAINAAKWKLHADIVHIHAVGPALLAPYARALGLKVTFTHHGPDYDREKWGKTAKFILRLGERFGCRFANEVIVISNVINDIIQKKYDRNNAHLIRNGVAPPIFVRRTDYLIELGVEPRKYLFAMGRFVPEKNFHALIEAYTQLNRPDIRLVIAGDADIEDDYSRRLKAEARNSGAILTGFIKGERLQSLLTHARLFVLPSSHEGLPIALLEAMSYGLPVLAGDISANKEVGLPDSCYFRCDEDIVVNLTNALKKRIDDDSIPVSYDLSLYNWDLIADQTIRVYQAFRL